VLARTSVRRPLLLLTCLVAACATPASVTRSAPCPEPRPEPANPSITGQAERRPPEWIVTELDGVQTRTPFAKVPAATGNVVVVSVLEQIARGATFVRVASSAGDGTDDGIWMLWDRGMLVFTCALRGREHRLMISKDFPQEKPTLIWCE
jgi:hypothetical protein